MNYLAHMALSFNQEEILMGNLGGDFMTTKEYRSLDPRIKAGVDLHRAIDRFTDDHPIVDKSIDLFKARHGGYAHVIVDILYDHLLHKHWDRYYEQSLVAFKKFTYNVLGNRSDELPAKLKVRIHEMIDKDFVRAYASKLGMQKVMSYMDQRTSFPSKFTESVDFFFDNISVFESHFDIFYPQLMKHAEETLTSLQKDKHEH